MFNSVAKPVILYSCGAWGDGQKWLYPELNRTFPFAFAQKVSGYKR